MPLRSAVGRGDPFTTNLRYEFFRAVDEVAPALASQMLKAIGPTFEQLAERLTGGDLRELAWIAREQKDFLAAWRKWAQPHGLHRDPWILDHALSLLPAFLSSDPDSRNPNSPPRFGAVPLLAACPVPGRQIAPPDRYRPDQETRADYLKRVGGYADLVEGVLLSTGWQSAPAKQYERVHLRWLARFQVKGESVAAIVRTVRPDRRNVERALQQMASLIGLTRRTISTS
jgi:hypothetical protein